MEVQSGPAPQAQSSGADRVVITDKHGRKLSLRKVGPMLRVRLFKLMGADNSRNVPLLGHYQMAISVVQIDDEPLPFPTSDTQIDALLDRIGDDGLEAIAKAWRDNKWVDVEDGEPDNIKN